MGNIFCVCQKKDPEPEIVIEKHKLKRKEPQYEAKKNETHDKTQKDLLISLYPGRENPLDPGSAVIEQPGKQAHIHQTEIPKNNNNKNSLIHADPHHSNLSKNNDVQLTKSIVLESSIQLKNNQHKKNPQNDGVPIIKSEKKEKKNSVNIIEQHNKLSSIDIDPHESSQVTEKKVSGIGEYKGNCSDGKAHGQGMLIMQDGSTYNGEFNKNLKHGKGYLKLANGTFYEGDFKDDQINGFGKLVDKENNVYEGNFENNKMHGHGKYTYSNGIQYSGFFCNNEFHGKGKLIANNKEVFDGEFENNVIQGFGTYTYDNGDKYTGYFKNNKKNGKGTYKYSNGDIFEGNFLNDYRHGKGKLTLAEGKQLDGNWAEDKLLDQFYQGYNISKMNNS